MAPIFHLAAKERYYADGCSYDMLCEYDGGNDDWTTIEHWLRLTPEKRAAYYPLCPECEALLPVYLLGL